ncbi:MAG: tRNA (guanosine(37)-N1)-methyltransferase TrmD [Clostridiaceae bacterium]|jgi:tRNA (guanine37-N1)-methyltransferase|nr:tRNA (guanosine(37)-N1)-methyltransferase TrmD [Clostridiaceae bacterium]
MKIDILTLFPEMVEHALCQSIIGRAQKKGILEFGFINIRDYSQDKHRRVDDYPYGGGNGMIMQPGPIYRAYKSVLDTAAVKPFVIYMSPQGKVLNQSLANQLSKNEHIVILCGHYEGIDERLIEEIVDLEVSIGDYVLTGGEIPALVLCDTVCRLVPGVLSCEESFADESHYSGLLEYPQYTRPLVFRGREVPDVLLSGHHANIEKWRLEQSIERTRKRRPDMLEKGREAADE